MPQLKSGDAKGKIYPILLGILLIVLSSTPSAAQYSEIGLSIGGTHYTGDLVRTFRPSTIRPGGSIFFRQNFSEAVSGRLSLGAGIISGDDQNPIDAFAEVRDYSFSVFLMQFDAAIEYHFLDFKSERALANYSPYLSLGLGLFYFNGEENPYARYSNIQPVIPIGLGIKLLASPRITLGAEFSARKTFFDYLDNVSAADMELKDYRYGNWYNNDWHYYLGFSIAYAFFDIPCPYKWK